MTPANLFIKSFKTDEKGEIEKLEVYQEGNRRPRKLIIKGVVPELEEKTIVANGTYKPGLDFDGFSKINVDVKSESSSKLYCWMQLDDIGLAEMIYTDSLDINANIYVIGPNADVTAFVLINPEHQKQLYDLSINILSIIEDVISIEYFYGEEESSIDTFQRCPEYDVIIPGSSEGIKLQEKTITLNGVVSPDNGFDGFSRVTVEVPQREGLQEKTVTENGTIYPDEGFAGFSKITVNVSNKLYCWHVDTSHINLFVYTNSFDMSTNVYVPIDGLGLQNQEQLYETIGIKVTIESISEDELAIKLSYLGNEDYYEEYTLSRLPENDIEL